MYEFHSRRGHEDIVISKWEQNDSGEYEREITFSAPVSNTYVQRITGPKLTFTQNQKYNFIQSNQLKIVIELKDEGGNFEVKITKTLTDTSSGSLMDFLVELTFKGTWLVGVVENLMVQFSGTLLDLYKTEIYETIETEKAKLPRPSQTAPVQRIEEPRMFEDEGESDLEFFDAEGDDSVLVEDLQQELDHLRQLVESTSSHVMALENIVMRYQDQRDPSSRRAESLQEHLQRFDRRLETFRSAELPKEPLAPHIEAQQPKEQSDSFSWVEGTIVAGLLLWPFLALSFRR